MTDEHVKRKLMAVLASWHRQFKDDPKMSTVSGLYAQCGGGKKVIHIFGWGIETVLT